MRGGEEGRGARNWERELEKEEGGRDVGVG